MFNITIEQGVSRNNQKRGMRQGQEGLIDLHHRADVSRNKGEVAWGGVGEEKCGMMYPLAIQSHLENVYCCFFSFFPWPSKGGGGVP